MIKEYRN